ncbi:hypothetical protein DL93DRAFT_2100477 [Clavulina sp. PMI_390]|nr:hypothetical protein DL93DRAFT_2100477 [Clavulina sp. PMI_390]
MQAYPSSSARSPYPFVNSDTASVFEHEALPDYDSSTRPPQYSDAVRSSGQNDGSSPSPPNASDAHVNASQSNRTRSTSQPTHSQTAVPSPSTITSHSNSTHTAQSNSTSPSTASRRLSSPSPSRPTTGTTTTNPSASSSSVDPSSSSHHTGRLSRVSNFFTRLQQQAELEREASRAQGVALRRRADEVRQAYITQYQEELRRKWEREQAKRGPEGPLPHSVVAEREEWERERERERERMQEDVSASFIPPKSLWNVPGWGAA